MAGHSKWANIKHRKEKADSQKGKVFSRIIKEIISSVKHGGPDSKSNMRLKAVMLKAKEANIPGDTVERNIKKATSSDQQDFVEVTYELYGAGGVGVLVKVLTDNKNRIASEIRSVALKWGGTLAAPGAVAFNFERKGVIRILKNHAMEDELFAVVSEQGAEDFVADEEGYVITSAPELLLSLKEAIQHHGFLCDDVSVEMIPKSWMECKDEERQSNELLIENIEKLDDVDEIYHNMKE